MKIIHAICALALLASAAQAQDDGVAAAVGPAEPAAFTLRSPVLADGGRLPTEFTGDGAAATLPLSWSGMPAETKSLVLIMHHVAPDMTKWYWILYDLPATTTVLPKNVHGLGTLGSNSVNHRCEYAPPHSKGPGDKEYIYTLYALSSRLQPADIPGEADRAALLAAMQGRILASAALHVVYARDDALPTR